MTRAGEALIALRRQLAAASPSADLDAEVLLAHVLGVNRASVAADPGRTLSQPQVEALSSLAQRRQAGEPVAYLTGHREFWSLDLEVTPDVLVPRPESERVVELALDALASVTRPAVLDLGTGSGAIALALARERPDAVITAVDASAAALAVAARNALRLQVTSVTFLPGSWYEPVGKARFDCIVSNPPYVADDDPALASLRHEPRRALAAGPAGLDAIAVVCAGAPAHLAAGGALVVEHGATQGADVRALMTRAGLVAVATHGDLAGRPRATRGNSPRPALESALTGGSACDGQIRDDAR
jgi:release factor glutamine methyltransferase